MKKTRKAPKIGDVVAVPLHGDRWIYLLQCMPGYWVYRVASHGILKDRKLFESKEWLMPIDYNLYCFTVDCLVVCEIQITLDEYPRFYYYNGPHGNPATRFRFRFGNEDRYITEQETKGLPCVDLMTDMPTLRAHLETLTSRLTWIEGTPASPKKPQEEAEAEPETVDFEINELPVFAVSTLAESLADEFYAAEVEFECIGESDSGGNVAVRGNPKHAKKALSIIRAQLKAYVPDELLEDIEIEQIGPNEDERKIFGIKGPARPASE